MNERELLEDTLSVWCPNYPRRVATKMPNDRGWGQTTVYSDSSAIDNLQTVKYKAPNFVSVYAFPRGHTSDEGENIPQIDTIMFDLDFEGSADDPIEEWARDMSALLTRTRMIAKSLIEMDKAHFWRASLSGHKGIHLYLDFPVLDESLGSEQQFRNGLRNYTNGVVDALKESTGLSDLDTYIDVSSGKDLARLTRLPNTVHEKATKRFGELRYCVPVTIEELAKLTPKDYVQLTKQRRELTNEMRRHENERAGEIISNEIPLAESGSRQHVTGTYDPSRIEEYKKNANEDMDFDSLKFHLKRKPCILAFRESDEMFSAGQESHVMEINCMAAMMRVNAPIETMVEFFNVGDDFDREYTEEKIKELIAYNYSEFNCSKILQDAERFCLKEQCRIYNNSDDLT